ncbi:MAG: serine/threonine protein phosphatase, partial [Halobacteriota archaeon]
MTELARTLVELEDEDLRVLSAVERGMAQREWVPSHEIPGLARLPAEEAEYRVGRLEGEHLERTGEREIGYRLKAPGYDALALDALAERGSVAEVGVKIEV